MADVEEGRLDGDNKALTTEPPSSTETICSKIILVFSFILIVCTFPLSLCVCLRMVQVNMFNKSKSSSKIRMILYFLIYNIYNINNYLMKYGYRNMKELCCLDLDESVVEDPLAQDCFSSYLAWTTL